MIQQFNNVSKDKDCLTDCWDCIENHFRAWVIAFSVDVTSISNELVSST